MFGLYALQVGRAGGSVLAASRIRSQWVVDLEPDVDVVAQCDRLPFAENQFDLIALPHTLEADPWPHEVLREVHRVLRPEGQLLLTGFNPLSLFGLRRHLGRRDCTPWTHNFISLPRAKDWLTLLGFDLAIVSLTCFGLPVTQQRRLERFARIERWGEAYWPFLGGVYCIRAIKRVAGMRVIRPAWHGSRTRAATVSSATRPVPRQGNGHG
ncbi:MAG: class I SAM-dependent methyltransferase [Casimicrobiaceae bacterium]|nr:class I SAM-dependent methyltransferase [Casimicrobiaceae bacterium]